MKHRALVLGAGGMAGSYLRSFLPAFADRVEVAALVEVNRAVLESAADELGLPASARFTQLEPAFEQVDADCCVIVIPPAFHKKAALLAAQRGLHILTEKPLADTWDDAVAMYRAARDAHVKMQVVQNYRYTPRILTFKKVVQEGGIGPLHYLTARFAADYRVRGAWGAMFRHEMRHALLIEGGIHHFDQLRNLAGGDPLTVAGWEWNPGVASFDGECQGLYVIRMDNEVRGTYEGNCTAGGWQNTWHHEYYRAEGAQGAVVLDRDDVVRVQEFSPMGGLRTREVLPERPQWEGHQAIIAQFLDWLDGGPAPATTVEDNIKSVALLFGAIEASATDQTVDVAAKIAQATGIPD